MKIIWNQNPLRTKVILDDKDKEILRLKTMNEELLNHSFHLKFLLCKETSPSLYDPEKGAKKAAEFDYEYLGNRVRELTEMSIKELEGIHIGDCTCVPCTCEKCLAENYLGINTIEGLSKHKAYKIDDAFKNEDTTIDEAIENLEIPISEEPNEHYKDHPEMYRTYRPKWEQERLDALEWLINYKNEHFSG